MLFLHGGGVGGWMWRPVLDLLGDEVRAIVPDLPGHDGSAAEPYQGHDATVDALVELLDEAGIRVDLTVMGFSLGAQLAVALASREPARVSHALVVSAQASPLPFANATLRMLRATAPLARNERFARLQARELGVPHELMPDYVRTSRTMTADALVASVGANLAFAIPEEWAAFPGRVDVVVGARERAVMHTSAEALHGAVPGSRLTIVPETGHTAPLTRPDVIAQLLRERR